MNTTPLVHIALSCGLMLAASPRDRQADPLQPTGSQVRLVDELRRPGLYGTSRAEWRALNPTAAWRDRKGPRDYPPASTLPQHRGLWCSVATMSTGAVTSEAVFYGIRPERPYDCRLEQVRFVFPVGDDESRTYRTIAEALRQVWGGNEFDAVSDADRERLGVDRDTTAYTEYDSGQWQDLRYWMAPTQYVLLFRSGSNVQVIAQSYALAAALQDDKRSASSMDRYGISDLKWDLANALRPTDPEAVDVLLSIDAIPNQDIVERAALRLLQRRKLARTLDARAMLTFAADLVLEKVHLEGERPEQARPGIVPLLKLGVKLQESPYDAGIWNAYLGSSAAERRRYESTRWTMAFFPALPDTRLQLTDGQEYLIVIEQGNAWLRRHARSPFAVSVMSDIAIAYETWWSVSLAPDDEELVGAAAPGADRARVRAIQWYERVIREYASSREAEHARRVLVQIRMGVDTGERTFSSRLYA